MKNYIILGLSILLTVSLIWLSYEIRSPETSVEKIVDTTKVVERDTIHAADTTRTIDPPTPDPDTVFSDTLIKTETDTFRTGDNKYAQFRVYNTEVSDSLITGNIKTTVKGFLVTQNFSYTPQYPLQINVNTKTRITERVTRTIKPGGYPSLGLRTSADFKTLNGIDVVGSWTTSNRNRFSISYNPTTKSWGIGVNYNLKRLF